MINININGEKVVITERTKLADLYTADAYAQERNGKVEIVVPKTQVYYDVEDIANKNLYVAGIVTADANGNMETVTNNVVFNGLVWDEELWDYTGIYLEDASIEELNAKAGIKVFFGVM